MDPGDLAAFEVAEAEARSQLLPSSPDLRRVAPKRVAPGGSGGATGPIFPQQLREVMGLYLHVSRSLACEHFVRAL